MRIINLETSGLIKNNKYPDITQISILDEHENVLLSANVKCDKIAFEARLVSGVPEYGVSWDSLRPLVNQLLVEEEVYVWSRDFDYSILIHHGVELYKTRFLCDKYTNFVNTRDNKKLKRVRIPKKDYVQIKGFQSLGKCFIMFSMLKEIGCLPVVDEEDFNLDF